MPGAAGCCSVVHQNEVYDRPHFSLVLPCAIVGKNIDSFDATCDTRAVGLRWHRNLQRCASLERQWPNPNQRKGQKE